MRRSSSRPESGPNECHAHSVLTAVETQTAGVTPVWVVWWEDPDRSWEALCLSLAECETEYALRQADPLIQQWGRVGKSEQQTLLAWLDGHLHVIPSGGTEDFVNPAKEFLRRVAAGESGPVHLRTW
jgi:hypothetical protein